MRLIYLSALSLLLLLSCNKSASEKESGNSKEEPTIKSYEQIAREFIGKCMDTTELVFMETDKFAEKPYRSTLDLPMCVRSPLPYIGKGSRDNVDNPSAYIAVAVYTKKEKEKEKEIKKKWSEKSEEEREEVRKKQRASGGISFNDGPGDGNWGDGLEKLADSLDKNRTDGIPPNRNIYGYIFINKKTRKLFGVTDFFFDMVVLDGKFITD